MYVSWKSSGIQGMMAVFSLEVVVSRIDVETMQYLAI